jgi:hypothetical protein
LHKLIKLDSVRNTNWETSLSIAKFIKKDDLW